ncbi:fructose-1,6-bisphosphatase, class ii [Heliomicrobium modesticaldum Ice1]|uniref:Fructose-1,6-bisphosphatase n=1 Tax=Heliobacterium modesticaldum (strain ATCC 51547 / Ice1) TaxID=498761 RepID=B0TI76_HELMI|nr:class II fructose-bisphosphatase [Heliomicrobium modesticaldum]ABZ83496.1 fructose-1,6-bisphosphatase, class ii [Heliomicrobium modesticaldum Ice1]
MYRELALEFARVTEAAALASARWMGRGDKHAADDAATEAMRAMFDTVSIDGVVVIGEGEMDEAPMLYIGEKVGAGGDAELDIAVDPLEGTNIVAKGLNGAISVLAAAHRGCLLHAPDMYMDKIAVGPAAVGRIHLDAPVEDNLKNVADALGKKIDELSVVILDRPRHSELISRCRKAGARIQLIPDGDVAPAVATAFPDSGIDIMMGIGGAPEGVIAAAAIRCLGGEMQGRLCPETAEEEARCVSMGLEDPRKILLLEDMVRGDGVIFAATGITDGSLLKGVKYTAQGAVTHTVVIRGRTGTVRFINALHRLDRKPHFGRGRNEAQG